MRTLTELKIRRILDRLPNLTISVVGDFFLDKYLDIDARLTEKSIETGLDAYQVSRVRTSPGAGGTVTNNLSALGVGRILALTVLGRDGEGFELRSELTARRVDLTHVIETPDRRTPTYTKPMLDDGMSAPRELNRIDIKNRMPMPAMLVREVAKHLDAVVAESHAVIIADQVSEPDCGVMCLAVRERLAELAQRFPDKIILADSRNRIAQFRGVIVKPNWGECLRSVGVNPATGPDRLLLESSARQLIRRTGRSVYCTIGEQGMLVIDRGQSVHVPSFSVSGPIDIVGAGDSATAGIVCALCDQADAAEAAELGNLIASITIQQLGSTGTATPDQILARWREVTEP